MYNIVNKLISFEENTLICLFFKIIKYKINKYIV